MFQAAFDQLISFARPLFINIEVDGLLSQFYVILNSLSFFLATILGGGVDDDVDILPF